MQFFHPPEVVVSLLVADNCPYLQEDYQGQMVRRYDESGRARGLQRFHVHSEN
jgi:hypothetical protein